MPQNWLRPPIRKPSPPLHDNMSATRYKFSFVLLLALLLAACRQAPPSGQESDAPLLKAEAERGPLSFRISADRDSLTIDEKITLTFSAEAPEEYQFEFPKFGEGLEAFGIVDYKTEPARISDRKSILYSRSYVLEPLFAETYEIPALKGIFHESGGEGRTHELETEPFAITVDLPPPEFWETLDIDSELGLEPASALISAQKQSRRQIVIGIGGALLLALAVCLYFRRRKKRIESMPPIPPEVKAFAALQKLIDEDFIGKNQFKLFYLHISAILRVYIEEQFQVRAPELTTEEFLEILVGGQSLLKKHQRLLRDFLTHCDMVKFAEHQPDKEEIQQTFDSCKAFISQTVESA